MKKKVVKQGIICGCLILMIGILVAGKGANKDDLKEESDLKEYNLPIEEQIQETAENDCVEKMELIYDIYKAADKGEASNVSLSEETIYQMVGILKETGIPVTASGLFWDMYNYEEVEKFLESAKKGESGEIVIYDVLYSGGIVRRQFEAEGTDMHVLESIATWNGENSALTLTSTYTRIKEWKYTDKGWFCYKLCVPEYPDTTEIVDGSKLLRIKPMNAENRKATDKYVRGLCYQGNNVLCSNWDSGSLEILDYNGVYEYLYEMEYGEIMDSELCVNGIPAEEFEKLIMKYFPLTKEQIRQYAIYDEESQTYPWISLGCSNYAPSFFGTSFPEVTNIKENDDGTLTLTVDAVCEMIFCDDAAITHELTVRVREDGSFQYLGNKILGDGIERIPEYEYRITR